MATLTHSPLKKKCNSNTNDPIHPIVCGRVIRPRHPVFPTISNSPIYLLLFFLCPAVSLFTTSNPAETDSILQTPYSRPKQNHHHVRKKLHLNPEFHQHRSKLRSKLSQQLLEPVHPVLRRQQQLAMSVCPRISRHPGGASGPGMRDVDLLQHGYKQR